MPNWHLKGRIGWIWPRGGGPPLLGSVLDGQSDATDHWAHIALNHEPGDSPAAPEQLGRAPRYYRLQVRLPGLIGMDDASPEALAGLAEAADALIAERDAELDAIAGPLEGRSSS